MRKLVILVFALTFKVSFAGGFTGITTTELIDQAQQSLKEAFEAGCAEHTPYEYYKAEAYYNLAKEEASLLNLEAGRTGAENSIKWSLKAVMKRYDGKITKNNGN